MSRGAVKSAQLNASLTPEGKELLKQKALERGLSVAEFLEGLARGDLKLQPMDHSMGESSAN